MEWIRFGACAASTLFGLFCLITGVLGVYRFRFSLNRIHAASLLDTVGLLFVFLGLIIAFGLDLTSVKLIVVLTFQWLTSPVATHLIGELEVITDPDLSSHLIVDDPEALDQLKEGR